MHATQTTKTTAQSTKVAPNCASAALARALDAKSATFVFDPDQDSAVLKARNQLQAVMLKPGSRLARLGDDLLDAYTDEARWCLSADRAQIGRDATSEEAQLHIQAIDATYEAMRALAAYRPKNLDELAKKTAMLDIGVDGSLLEDLGIEDALAADRERLSSATAQTSEVMSPRAASALLAVIADPKACDKQRRRDLDTLFPAAKQPEARLKWRGVAASIKELHRALLNETKVGDDQSVVGEAYRWAQRASHRDSGATVQMVAHTAIEEMAKSFVSDGTYANYAVNPDGIRCISGLVGDLQITARDLMRTYAGPLSGLAIESVFFSKSVADERAEWEAEGATLGREEITAAWKASGVRAGWDAAVAKVDAARSVFMSARQAQYDFEVAFPDVPASDPKYVALDAAHNAADTAHFAALHALLQTPAPDAAALARQIQVYGWLNNVTSYKLDGLTGWPLDPTDSRVAEAIDADDDADNDDRGILALYRSALALAGGVAPPAVAPEIADCAPALLAAE